MATNFAYLLNAMERAAGEHNPAEHDYRAKRTAVLAHVAALEAERDELAAELATLRSPNLVWDSTNPEDSSVDSIEDAVYQYIDWFGDTKVGDELTFFVARKLPNVTVRITSVNEDGEATFDVVNTALRG